MMKLLPTSALRNLGVQVGGDLGSRTSATVMSESYITTLSAEAKTRYEEKIKLIGGLDPYSSNLGKEIGNIPPVDAADMLSYLVLQTSYLTSQQFKARKSLQAYNQFISGWVKDVKTWLISGKYLVKGKVSVVSRSQTLY